MEINTVYYILIFKLPFRKSTFEKANGISIQ